MSLYEPTVIAPADYGVARRPAFGGELKVYLSAAEVFEVGAFKFSAAATGVWDGDEVTANVLSADPSDLSLVVSPELKSTADVVVTVTGTDATDIAMTGTATIKAPGWVPNQTSNFQEGYAVDVVPDVPGKMFKTVTGVTATNGTRGAAFKLFKLPAASSYSLVGCTTSKDFSTKTRPPKGIACGMDGGAFVKQGRSEAGSLSISQKHVSFADGLARFAGQRCTAKAVLDKEDTLITEVLVFGNYVPGSKPAFPDGDEEATNSVEGMYEQFFAFVAK